MRTRAYRRHKARVKFKKRLKIWFSGWNSKTGKQERNRAIDGTGWTFLRSTSTPCSCDGCRYPIFQRPTQSEIKKEIQEQLEDFEDFEGYL